MTATEALERHIDELCAEVERLRGQLEYDRQTSRSRAELIDRLKIENAKLRELVRDMYVVISDRNSWWDCTRKDTRRFADHMRELGVEVDG